MNVTLYALYDADVSFIALDGIFVAYIVVESALGGRSNRSLCWCSLCCLCMKTMLLFSFCSRLIKSKLSYGASSVHEKAYHCKICYAFITKISNVENAFSILRFSEIPKSLSTLVSAALIYYDAVRVEHQLSLISLITDWTDLLVEIYRCKAILCFSLYTS